MSQLDNPHLEETIEVKASETVDTGDTQEETKVTNLNSLADDGFDVIPDDPEPEGTLLTQPKPDRMPAKNDVPDEKLFEEPIVEGEVPKFEAEFEIQADKANALSDIVRIQSDIEHKGAISVEDIKQVDSILPGFVNDEHPAEQYTALPTKTNYQEGLNNIDNYLEKQYDDLRVSIKDLTEQYLRANSTLIENINKKFTAGITVMNKAYAQLLFNTQKQDASQVVYLLNNGLRWSGFLSTSVIAPTSNEVAVSSGNTIEEKFKNTFVKPYIDRIIEVAINDGGGLQTFGYMGYSGGSFVMLNRNLYQLTDEGIVPSNNVKFEELYGYFYAYPTYGTILDVLVNGSAIQVLNKLTSVIEANLNLITESVNNSASAQTQEEPIAIKIKNLSLVSAMINKAIHDNNTIAGFMENVFSMYQIYGDMIKELAEKNKPVDAPVASVAVPDQTPEVGSAEATLES